MPSLNWLHLTDLHWGLSGQRCLWPNIETNFFEDLKKLHKVCGPWDLILFTGDLVQSGAKQEFGALDEVLRRLYGHLNDLNSNPYLLAVPGNHDLTRPDEQKLRPAVRLLTDWSNQPEVQQEFWNDTTSDYRKVVGDVFQNYMEWSSRNNFPRPTDFRAGLVPGDFAATIDQKGMKLGVIGLNTAFLQLTRGNYKRRLATHPMQLNAVCDNQFNDWFKRHDLCLLITHHPPDWLTDQSRELFFAEIAIPGRFAGHLYGHVHKAHGASESIGGSKVIRTWQGLSLFGLEAWEENGQTYNRRHGYAAYSLNYEASCCSCRKWPREAVRHQSGPYRLVPDHSFELNEDGGTVTEQIELTKDIDKGTGPRIPGNLRRKRFICSRITAQELLDLSSLNNPYDKFSNPIDFIDNETESSIFCSLWFPKLESLKSEVYENVPVAAICLVDPSRIVEILSRTLDGLLLEKITKFPLGKLWNEDKEKVFSAMGITLGDCFAVAVTIPHFMLSMRKTKPRLAYRIMTNLVLPPLLGMHSRIGVHQFHLRISKVGEHNNKALLKFCREILGAIYPRKGTNSIEFSDNDNDWMKIGYLSYVLAWAVSHYHNSGDGKWISLLERRFN